MPVGDIFRCQVEISVNGRKCSNVIHAQMLGAPVTTDETFACGTAFKNSIVDEMSELMSNEAQICNVKVWAIDSALPPSFFIYDNDLGDITGPSLPANKNAKILLRQSVFSARTNGELRLTGIPEADADGNTYTGIAAHPGPIGDLIELLTNSFPSIIGALGEYQVVIPTSGLEAQGNPPVPNYNKCTSASMSALIHSDRRRTARHQSMFNTGP